LDSEEGGQEIVLVTMNEPAKDDTEVEDTTTSSSMTRRHHGHETTSLQPRTGHKRNFEASFFPQDMKQQGSGESPTVNAGWPMADKTMKMKSSVSCRSGDMSIGNIKA